MLGAATREKTYEEAKMEGRKAKEQGMNSWDNPYDYRWEPMAANGWDDGFANNEAGR